VITNSCVEMNKAASNHFNKRVVECRLAAQILARLNSLEWRKIRKFLDLQNSLKYSLQEMIDLTKKSLHENAYTKTEICFLLNVTEDELAETSLSSNTLESNFLLCYLKFCLFDFFFPSQGV
jgi:N-acetylgalactosamine kinase